MIGVFLLIAYAMKDETRISSFFKDKHPLPTSEIEPVSDIVRLEGRDYYAIQFGVYEKLQTAQEKALEYVERGAAGYIWMEDGKYRVLAAVYTSLSDAQTIKERLKSQGIDAYVYTIRQEALEMRVSASETQQELLVQMFAFLPRAVREIGDISLALDKQTMHFSEAAERMGSIAYEAKSYEQRAQSELGTDENGVIVGIKQLLALIAQKSEDFSQNSQEDLYTTAKIKYNYLEVLWNVRRFVQGVLTLSDA